MKTSHISLTPAEAMARTVTGHCQATFQDYTLRVGHRIKLMPHTDMWMRGARCGQITSIGDASTIRVKLDSWPRALIYTVDDMRPIDFK